jgi:rhamnosyltransferase
MAASNKAAVVAHYHENGDVPQDLYELVLELTNYCAEIIFVSTNINRASQNRLEPYATILSRPNVGYDFWSYKTGIDSLKCKSDIDGLLILNSSIIVFNAKKLCKRFFDNVPETPNLFGLTSSYEKSPHVQSFWVYFNTKDLLNSTAFESWWRDLEQISELKEVITKLELGMSKYFSEAGYPHCGLFVPTIDQSIIGSCRAVGNRHVNINSLADIGDNFSLPINLASRVNPTSIYWDIILNEFDFIKEKQIKSRSNLDFKKNDLVKYVEKHSLIDAQKCIKILHSRGIPILNEKIHN